ncbi:MAG: 50S ribosomal protein L13 [Patescibacteria group bacterium]|nr:50S ribosomal protein L13 [Patescibacteria group bacterium]
MSVKTHTIDATGKSLGRLASEISRLLIGKHKVTYAMHLDDGDAVTVENVEKIKITGKKLQQKTYKHHTRYLGHLKTVRMDALFAKDPKQVLIKAVYSMLPETKHRRALMARLRFE